MPVSSRGYVYRLKFLPLPFDVIRYGPPNPNRDLWTIFMVCEWSTGHGQLHGKFYNHLSFPYKGRQILLRRVTIYVRVLLTFCKFFRENLIILIYYQLVRL